MRKSTRLAIAQFIVGGFIVTLALGLLFGLVMLGIYCWQALLVVLGLYASIHVLIWAFVEVVEN